MNRLGTIILEFFWGVFAQYLMCRDCSLATSSSGWLGVWGRIERRLFGCYTLMWRISQVFGQVGETLQIGPVHHIASRGLPGGYFSITIRHFMYDTSTDITRAPLSPEFDYMWEMVKSEKFQRTVEQREIGKRWLAQHLSIDSEGQIGYWTQED